jgi:hypothetical protein
MTNTTNAGPEPMFTAAMYGSAEAARDAEIAWLREQLGQCFRLSGADPDGNENSRLAPRAVDAVRQLRQDYDQTCDEAEKLRQRVAELERLLDQTHVESQGFFERAESLRAECEALRADAEWKFTADALPEDGRLVLFEVDAKAPSRFEYLDGQVFACTYYTANERYGSAFGVPGLTIRASRWRYVQGPPSIDAARAAREEQP